jgi:cyclase
VVKGVNFKDLRDAGDPVEVASQYDQEQADELVFLDITASSDRREIMKKMVEATAEEIFMPLTVGGGLRSTDDMRTILVAGADKTAINTAAVEDPSLIERGAERFGSQCIVVAIDGKRVDRNERRVYTHGGRERRDRTVLEWAKEAECRGAGEILLTSMNTDGTKEGYDIPLLKKVTSEVTIPVIASGGAGEPQHFVDVFERTNASAALAASVFHYDQHPVPEVKEYCRENDVPIRPLWKDEL